MADLVTAGGYRAITWSVALSVLMIVAGLLAIGLPVVAGIAVTAVVGWLLIFSGALHLAFVWRASRAGAVVWKILVGLVYGAIGFYLLARPAAGLASLTFAVAIYLFVEGVLEFILSFQLRPAGLVHEAQRLYGRNDLAAHDQARLGQIQVQLDQCSDLLRPRRAGASSTGTRTAHTSVPRPSGNASSNNMTLNVTASATIPQLEAL
jgi:Short repeat of unknown function (DUF308)/Protein of unknown function (DUF2630)